MQISTNQVVSSLSAIAKQGKDLFFKVAKASEAYLHKISDELVTSPPQFSAEFGVRASSRSPDPAKDQIVKVHSNFQQWLDDTVPTLNRCCEMAQQFVDAYAGLNDRRSYHQSLSDSQLIQVPAVCRIYYVHLMYAHLFAFLIYGSIIVTS